MRVARGHGSHRPQVGGGGMIPLLSLVPHFTGSVFLTLGAGSGSGSLTSASSMVSRPPWTVTQGRALVQQLRGLTQRFASSYEKWQRNIKWTIQQSPFWIFRFSVARKIVVPFVLSCGPTWRERDCTKRFIVCRNNENMMFVL